MLVLRHVETYDFAVVAARRDDRDFARERHESFENAGPRADLAPGRIGIAAVLDRRLAFAVVAEAPGLEHGRAADALDRRRQLGRRRDVRERRGADAERGDEILLGKAVLRGGEDFRVGQNRNARGEKRRGFRRHVLEFIGDDIDVGRKTVERLIIVVIGAA